MIHLETDQPLATDPAWAVLAGGDYAADDLVEVYRTSDPSQVVAHYAQYILDGNYP